jgi:hypothetical protein
MNPKQFLLLGGIVLVLVGVLGFIEVIGPTSEQSLFGSAWWFDMPENWAHLIIGIVGIIGSFILPAGLQKAVVLLLGVFGLVVGIYSGVVSTSLLGANLENPADTVLHIAVGAWALFAALKGGMAAATTSQPMSQPRMPM